jgi:hypothetical protein
MSKTRAGLDKTKTHNGDGTYTKQQYTAHCGERQRRKNLERMARAELTHLRKKHGTTVLLNGCTPEGVCVEPVRAKRFDEGIVDLQEHEHAAVAAENVSA